MNAQCALFVPVRAYLGVSELYEIEKAGMGLHRLAAAAQ